MSVKPGEVQGNMQISEIQIDGFRSLVKLTIDKFQNLNVFHGFNNSGKSNILAFLELIFKRKLQELDVLYTLENGTRETRREKRPVYFWKGNIENFSDNFFKDKADTISFSVSLTFLITEMNPPAHAFPAFFNKMLKKDSENKILMDGNIKKINSNEALFLLSKVTLNKDVLLVIDPEERDYKFIPSLEKIELSLKSEAVEKLLSQFNDAVKVISCHRFLSEEREADKKERIADVTLTPEKFKNWIFGLSLDREKYPIFQKIIDWFSTAPFKYGNISFARIGDHIEIMVEKEGLILPIKRLGSGVQQLLILLSHIADCSSKIIGIEELELNLSPTLQTQLLNNLRSFINSPESPVKQLFITSHSERYYDIAAINKYFVDIDNGMTKVEHWSEASKAKLIPGGGWDFD